MDLTYLVELGPGYDSNRFREDVAVGFTGMSGSGELGIRPAPMITCAALPGRDLTYQLFVRLDSDTIGVPTGGLARAWSLLLGNPFRHSLVQTVCLTRVEASEALCSVIPGPCLGSGGVLDRTLSDQNPAPLIGVPLPLGLNPESQATLVASLVRAGVRVLCDSPLHGTDLAALERNVTLCSKIADSLDERFFYFANGTVSLPILERLVEYIEQYDHPRLSVGLRLCPLSMGLNSVSLCAAEGVPVYGYNMVDIGSGPRGWTVGALTTVFRLAGCDLITMGLLASAAVASRATADMVVAASADLPGFRTALPVFTGGITPRVAHEIASRYGNRLVLHTKRPILRHGNRDVSLQRNVAAIREGAAHGLAGRSITEVMRAEKRESYHWRSYENEYGKE